MKRLHVNTYKNKIGCILLFSFVLFVTVIYHTTLERRSMVTDSPNVADATLSFSVTNSFHDTDFSVAITPQDGFSIRGMQIHYTLDGSAPTPESAVYTEPISFSCSEELTPYVLKAAVSYQGKMGPALTKTYFCGTHVASCFSIPVVCISIAEEELYDEETGIYTNYQEREGEWIRNAFVEVYDTDGNAMISQNIGLGLSGVTSSMYDIKPFKLHAGTAWDKISKFDNIWNTLCDGKEITFVPTYRQLDKINTLKLKNGGSGDYYLSRMREVVCMKLALESGLTPITEYYPAFVYLNGSFYDIMQMTSNYSANNLSKIYSLEEDKVMIRKDSENAIVSKFANKAYLLTADYTNPSVIADFESTFDKENFFLYYAIQLLTGNTDWPQNNHGAWRYTGAPVPGNVYSDGRVRFLLYDLSSTYRLESENEIFENLLNAPSETKAWLYHVLQNPEYKRYFVNVLCDLLSTTFDTEHVMSVIEEQYAICRDADCWIRTKEYGEASKLASTRADSVDSLKEKASERIWFIRKGMADYLGADYFNPDAKYTLDIFQSTDGIAIQCNSLYVTSSFQGTYYKNYPVLLQALPFDGYAFDYWLINGAMVTDSSLFLMPDFITGEQVTVQAVCHQTEGCSPIISAISASGSNDWITLYNPYANDIYLGNYYLSNTADNLTCYRLPKVSLKSKETIVIQGKNASTLGGYYMNLRIRTGDTFYLSTENTVLDSVFVPEMGKHAIYERYLFGKRWCYRLL